MRAHRPRYWRAVAASGECAATSARSMRRGVIVRIGEWIALAATADAGSATATGISIGSWSGSDRIRSTAPSRSALSRMFCMRLMSISFNRVRRTPDTALGSCRDMGDAAENRQLELVAQLAFVVHRSVTVLAEQRETGAEDDAGED